MTYNKEFLRECPEYDVNCPYYGWETHKCIMHAEEKEEPKENCDTYFGIE